VADEEAVAGGQHDRRSVLRAGLWLSANGIIQVFTTAALSIILGRRLGAAALGEQSLIAYVGGLCYALLVGSLIDAGIRTLSAVRGAGDQDELARLERWLETGLLVTGLVAGSIVAGIGLTTSNPLPWCLLALAMAIDSRGWSAAARVIAVDGWAPVARRRLVSQVSAQLLSIALVFAGAGIAGVFGASVVASAVLTVVLVRLAGRRRTVPYGSLPKDALRLWWMFVLTAGLTQVVGARIEFVFLGALSTTTQVAMYSVPFMLVSSVGILPSSMIGAALPALAASSGAGREDLMHEVLARGTRVVASLSLPITAGVMSVGPSLVLVLYGEEFRQAAELVPLMAITLVVTPVASLCSTFWNGRGQLRIPLMTGLAGGILDIALALLLIPEHGAGGATVANVAGAVVASLTLAAVTWRRVGRFPLEVGTWLRSLVVSVVGGLGAWYAATHVPGILGLLAGAAVGIVLVGGGAALLGILSHDDAAWMVDAAPARLRKVARIVTRAGGASA
jgi:O-antigen/teichoic acid export membrane protein